MTQTQSDQSCGQRLRAGARLAVVAAAGLMWVLGAQAQERSPGQSGELLRDRVQPVLGSLPVPDQATQPLMRSEQSVVLSNQRAAATPAGAGTAKSTRTAATAMRQASTGAPGPMRCPPRRQADTQGQCH
jgi:hypothetical protein